MKRKKKKAYKFTIPKKVLQKYIKKGLNNKQIAKTIGCSSRKVQADLLLYGLTVNNNIRRERLDGFKFKGWTVDANKFITRKSGAREYLYRCDKCGIEKYAPMPILTQERINPCGCFPWENLDHKYLKGKYSPARIHFRYIRTRAKNSGLEWNLDTNYLWNLYIEQNKKCKLSGISIFFARQRPSNNKNRGTASLDRIDSSKGYIIGNVQWVHKKINQMKWTLNEKTFIKWCELIYKYNTSNNQNSKDLLSKAA